MDLAHFRFRAMGSPCELQLRGRSRKVVREIANACRQEIDRPERKFSRYRDDSLATRINRSAGGPDGVEVDSETAALLDFAAAAHAESEGRFDPTSGVLRRVWDFKSGRLPEGSEVEEVLELVGWSKLEWQDSRIVLPIPGMELDFGGFVKEYAADRVAELCRQQGARHGLIDLGGDLAVVGPHPDGRPWQVGIRDPHEGMRALLTLAVYAGGIATSGDYERSMVVDGVRYSHLLDPRTGWPVEGLAGVSVVADQCLVAGTATTIAMLKGKSGAAWLQRLGLPYLWIRRDGLTGGSLWPNGKPDGNRPSAPAP